MDNSSFDKRIKDALLRYNDSTPVSTGWSRLNLPQNTGWALKPWLVGSLAVNAVLIGIVVYLYLGHSELTDRMNTLEYEYAESSNEPFGPFYRSYPIQIGKLNQENQQHSLQNIRASSNKPLFFLKSPDLTAANKNYDNHLYHESSRGLMPFGLIPPTENDRELMMTEIKHEYTASIENKSSLKKEIRIDRAVLMDLEKSRFGKGVKMEYGFLGNAGYYKTQLHYVGYGWGLGAMANMWFHPFWSIKSGLSFQNINLFADGQDFLESEWSKFSQGSFNEELNSAQRNLRIIRIPLVLEHHFMWSQNTTIDIGVGANQSILLNQRIAFNGRRLEEEEDHEEDEYHTFIRSFSQSGVRAFSTNMHCEMAIIHRIKKTPFFWRAGVFYEKTLRGFRDVSEMNVIGVSAAISMKK